MNLDLAAQRAALTPARPAVRFGEHWYTYAELNHRAARLAAWLYAQGVGKGDRVSILAPNHLAHLDLILATAKLGFIYAPLNYRLSATEQAAIVRYLEPACLLSGETQGPPHGFSGTVLSLTDYEAWQTGEADAEAFPEPDLTPEDTQMILLTGGTTGTPKGAMQPYRQGFANAAATVLSWGLRDDDCAVQATPCFHAAVNALTLPLLHLGARVVLQSKFDPADYLRLLVQESCTLVFMVPTMFKLLADHPGFAETDVSRVRWAVSGGAPCPEPVRAAFASRVVRFKQGYGLTEAGVNCFAAELDAAAARPETVGKPILYTEACIRDAEGAPVVHGEVGELTLRGPHVFSGYFRRPEATAEALRDGWLYTGDLAYRDQDGFYYLVGRRKEMFISGGENVFPAEVERALYEHPAVSECAVLGVPDARWGEVGLAAVVLAEPISEDTLRAFLKERLATYKVPKHLVFAEALPKNSAGKILKRQLAEAFVPAGEVSE